jgi:hypothetical protein
MQDQARDPADMTEAQQAIRKQIYTYEAPWLIYAMNWSVRDTGRFRLALGSFIEEYSNKVQVGMLICAVSLKRTPTNRLAIR